MDQWTNGPMDQWTKQRRVKAATAAAYITVIGDELTREPAPSPSSSSYCNVTFVRLNPSRGAFSRMLSRLLSWYWSSIPGQ